ncbi:hypothetical protein [Micromonospora aurantiaca (nom. illeg.)]|uniref:hypothetical protein n=1 Tax=Micromonospora aurantiaca (nom. illeg.) TaxID=47850 RepID=UPI003F49EDA1
MVRPDEGDPYEVTANARDVLWWEKTNRGASFASLMADLRLVELYKIAHHTCRRLGMFSGDLKEFEATCDIDGFATLPEEDEGESKREGEGEPDPTRPAP